jgi:hypothetical protein
MAIENLSGARWRWIILAGALVSGPMLGQSADADIEAVQRKLDAAKKAQADREAAQRANAAAQSRMSTLVIKADRDCALSVNGQSKGKLIAEQTTSVKVQAGEQLIECVSEDRQRVEVTQRVPAGEQVVVRLTVRPPERFEAVADGVKDHDHNLVWASADNGADIDWGDAQHHCTAKGSGWALPSVAQLQALYDASGTLTQSCGSNWICKVTPLIRLSRPVFWGSEPNGSSEAWYVFLPDGDRVSRAVVAAVNARALCVRRS